MAKKDKKEKQLLAWLLDLDRIYEAEQLMKQYDQDINAAWPYTQALLCFRKEGDITNSRDLLEEAKKANPHVIAFITGKKKIPKVLPEYVGIGDQNEAIAFAADFLDVWKKTNGAIEWVKTSN